MILSLRQWDAANNRLQCLLSRDIVSQHVTVDGGQVASNCFLHRSRHHALSYSCIPAHCSSAGLRADLAVPSIHRDGLHGLAIPLRTVRGQDDTFLSIRVVLIVARIHCRVSLTHKASTPVTLEPKDTLKLTFQVVDKETGKGVQPHQTFLRFYDENTHEEGIQPIRVTPGGKAKFELVSIHCSRRRNEL